MEKQESGFQLWPFLLGILSVFVGIMVFNNPLTAAGFVIYMIAFLAIFRGISLIIIRNSVKNATEQSPTILLVMGILNIIIGIFILFNVTASILALPVVFAIWFIVDSLISLLNAGTIREYSKGRFWFVVVSSIIGIILGVLLLHNPWASFITIAMLVGTYFIINGIINLIHAF